MASRDVMAASDGNKAKHIHLASIVKGVHAELRKQFKESGDLDQVWRQHCADNSILQDYADAMHCLATQIWTKHPETRIDWCLKQCKEYFFNGGLKKVLEKELRKKSFEQKCAVDNGKFCAKAGQQCWSDNSMEQVSTVEIPQVNVLSTNANQMEDYREVISHQIDSCHMIKNPVVKSATHTCTTFSDEQLSQEIGNSGVLLDKSSASCVMLLQNDTVNDTGAETHKSCVNQTPNFTSGDPELLLDVPYSQQPPSSVVHRETHLFNSITLPFQGRIRLLDVGSCYNAFRDFEDFHAVGIDISPAVESVHRCDFLHLDICAPLELPDDAVETFLKNLTTPIERLPSEMFHVVVFSLLLEYFPSPYQRWTCCQKAQKLLVMNGILVIITPDSHHQNRNAPMMKSWRIAMESMGFLRWRYEKLEHLHCLIFRKAESKKSSLSEIGDNKPEMLYIPQDLNCDIAETCDPYVSQTQEDINLLKSNFDELPSINEHSE